MKKLSLILFAVILCLSLVSCEKSKIELGFYQIEKAQEFNEYSGIGVTLEENGICTVDFSMTGDRFVGDYSVKGNTLTLSLDELSGEYINNTDIDLEYSFEIKENTLIFKGYSGSEIKYTYNITGEEMILKRSMHFEKGDKFTLQNADNNESFKAKVLETYEYMLLVSPLEDEREANSSDKINVEIPQSVRESTRKFKQNDIITVVYNGEILETYPASLGQVFDIKLAE